MAALFGNPRAARACWIVCAAVGSMAPWAHAGPLDDLIGNAVKAAKSAADAASAAIGSIKSKGAAPPKAPASAPEPSPAPDRAATREPPPRSTAASVPRGAAPSSEPAIAVTPTQSEPAYPSNWSFRVMAGPIPFVDKHWTMEEAQDYAAYTENVEPCSAARLAGGGANELFSQDLVSRIRTERDYPQMLGKLTILVAAAKKAPPSTDTKALTPAIRCLALLKQHFPELGKVRFDYFTFKAGKVVSKSGGLKDLLLDGAFDELGQTTFSPSFEADEVAALGELERSAKAAPAVTATAPPGPLAVGRPLPGLKRLTRELQATFSIGAYEAVALKTDGTVEVRTFMFPNTFNPFHATVGTGRVVPGLRNVVGVKAQATYDVIRIGSISATRDSEGHWMGWRMDAQATPIAFDYHFATLGLDNVAPPPSRAIINFSGGRASLWHLLADGSVLMASERGVLPGSFEASWEKDHKFTGIIKIVSTPGPSGSVRALFLKDDGTVWVNGSSFYQGWLIAEGTAAEKKLSPTADARFAPVRLRALARVRDIAAYLPGDSLGKAVALLEDGSVVWFKFDPGMPDMALSNVAVARVDRIKGARHVAAGSWGAGAVDAEGKVWVWGNNPDVRDADNRLMTGFRGGAPLGATDDEPTQVPGLADVLDIEFSTTFAGALRADGTVWVWNGQAPVKIFDGVKLAP